MQITCRRSSILTCLLAGLPMFGADVSPNATQIFDKQLGASEREVMAVVETMPPAGLTSSLKVAHLLTCEHLEYKLDTSPSVLMRSPRPYWGSRCFRTRIRRGPET
jgi:hypothetical protein